MDAPTVAAVAAETVSPLMTLVKSYLFFAAVIAWPIARILRRAGLSPWFAGLLALPVFGILAVTAVLAFEPWPRAQELKIGGGRK